MTVGAVDDKEQQHNDRDALLDLHLDWAVGIGGGLWTTGLLLCQHLKSNASFFNPIFQGRRVLYVKGMMF